MQRESQVVGYRDRSSTVVVKRGEASYVSTAVNYLAGASASAYGDPSHAAISTNNPKPDRPTTSGEREIAQTRAAPCRPGRQPLGSQAWLTSLLSPADADPVCNSVLCRRPLDTVSPHTMRRRCPQVVLDEWPAEAATMHRQMPPRSERMLIP